MKYRIIAAKSRKRLEEKVNGSIQEEWRPIGGVVVERDRAIKRRRTFYQGVVKGA
jgi:hypothetical protein